jgi:hypothetical protein
VDVAQSAQKEFLGRYDIPSTRRHVLIRFAGELRGRFGQAGKAGRTRCSNITKVGFFNTIKNF